MAVILLNFTNNILTIENSIDATDIDPVSFVLPVGDLISNLIVTNFSGTGTVTYTLSTDGATDITGTFTAKDVNILDGNPIFAIASDTTYTLTLTADAAITYTIVGTKTVDYNGVDVPSPVIHYTFDADGTNSGSLGLAHDLTIPSSFAIDTTNQYIGAGSLKAIRSDNIITTTDANSQTNIANIPIHGNGYTISLWAKIPAYVGYDQALLDFKLTGQDKNIIMFRGATSVLFFGPTGSAGSLVTLDSPFDNNYHHHLFVVNSNGDGTSNASYYIDTTLIFSYSSSEYPGILNNENTIYDLHIGASQWYNNHNINGYIDDFRIYDYGLTIDQVNSVYLNIPTQDLLTFADNTLTIENIISATDTDSVKFVLPVEYEMSNLNVTNFSGTGTVTYTLSTDGATDITGTFTAKDVNILDGTPIFAIASDTTYTLTLTADATIAYTIMGIRLFTMGSSEYSVSQLITAGYTQQQLIDGNFWIADDSANRFFPIYDDGLLDVSGGNMIVRDNFIMGSGNIDLSNALITQSCTIDADISVTNHLFVTGDVSIGAVGLNVAGDITIDGNLSVETYKENSISPSAVKSDADGSITDSNITAIMNDASYDKLQMNGDVSLNSTISTPGYTSTIDSLTFPLDFTTDSKMVAGTNTSDFGSSEKPVRINNTGNVIVTINSSKNMAYSVDYGENWSTYNTNVIAVNVSGDGNYICVVTTSNIYISADTGGTWSNPAGFSTTVGHIVSDTCLSYNGQYIFVMGGIEGSKTAVRSTDYGASFANAGYILDRGYQNSVTRASAAISDSGEYIMVTTENGYAQTTQNDSNQPGNAVYASSNYGENFTLQSPSIFSWIQKSNSVMSHDGQYQLAQAWSGRGSKNFGATWGRYNPSGLSGGFTKYPYTICRSHANVHISANDTDPNMYISINGGSTFNILSSSNMNTVVGATYLKYQFTVNADGSLIYFNTSDGRVGRLHVPGIGYVPPVYQASSDKVTYFGASTKLKLTNGIQLSDNTIVNTTNISSGTYATNNVVFKPSYYDNMTVTGDFASNPPLSASDYRIKTNIQELDETYTIDKLRPVTYYQTQMKKNAIGFIAHELQEHYPELVEGEKDGDKMQSVNYNGILAILINEIKNLKQNIKDTRNTLSAQNSAS